MRTMQTRAIAWITVLLVMLPALASAYRQGRLLGKVLDPDGKPIEGVRVTTTSEAIPDLRDVATTNAKGIFIVDFERLNVVYLHTFEKSGYVTLKIEQKWSVEGTERQEFKMLRAEEPTVGELPPALAALADPAILAFNAGVKAFKDHDYPTAQTKFEEATSKSPEMRQAWVALATIYLEQQSWKQAADAAEKAMALGARDESVLKVRWDAYRELGDEAKASQARADLDKFGRLTDEAKRTYNEGVALMKIQDEKEAFAKFQDALALDPNFEPALLGVATSGLAIGRAADADAAAETLLKVNPQNGEALKIRYNAALQLKDEKKVIAALLGLASVDATSARDGLFLLANSAFEKDDVAKAKELLGHVLEIDPDHARAHYLTGLILMREGAKKDAKAHLERFLQLAPNDPDARTAKDALKFLQAS